MTAPGDAERDDLERFREMLEKVGGHVHPVTDEAAALEVLQGLVREHGARSVAASDSPLAQRLTRALEGDLHLALDPGERDELLAADVGVSTAQWGVAETGTLVLVSSRERHRLVSLLPPVHVALLARESILPSFGAALEVLQGDARQELPQAVTFITGPSRTADIELTLVVGVHGPRALHVIVVGTS